MTARRSRDYTTGEYNPEEPAAHEGEVPETREARAIRRAREAREARLARETPEARAIREAREAKETPEEREAREAREVETLPPTEQEIKLNELDAYYGKVLGDLAREKQEAEAVHDASEKRMDDLEAQKVQIDAEYAERKAAIETEVPPPEGEATAKKLPTRWGVDPAPKPTPAPKPEPKPEPALTS
jgi:hypothetical protein